MDDPGIFESQSRKSGRKAALVVMYIEGSEIQSRLSILNLEDVRAPKVEIRKGEHPLDACCLFNVCYCDSPVHMIVLRK